MANYLTKLMQLRRNSQRFNNDTCSKSSSYYFITRTHINHTSLEASNKEMEIRCSQLLSLHLAIHKATKNEEPLIQPKKS